MHFQFSLKYQKGYLYLFNMNTNHKRNESQKFTLFICQNSKYADTYWQGTSISFTYVHYHQLYNRLENNHRPIRPEQKKSRRVCPYCYGWYTIMLWHHKNIDQAGIIKQVGIGSFIAMHNYFTMFILSFCSELHIFPLQHCITTTAATFYRSICQLKLFEHLSVVQDYIIILIHGKVKSLRFQVNPDECYHYGFLVLF